MFIAGMKRVNMLRSEGNNGGSAGQNTDPKDGDGANAGSGGGNGSGDSGAEEKVHTKAEMEAMAGRIREEEKRKFDKRIADEKAAAEKKKAEDQGEYQRLYEEEKQKAASLSVKSEAAERYASRIHVSIDNEIKDWPEEVTKLDPGKDDVDARMTWVENSRDLAKRLTDLSRSPNMEHGNGSRRPANNTNNPLARHVQGRYAVPGQSKRA